MNQKFWDLFTGDYKKNCSLWTHYEDNPVIPKKANSFKENWTANPDILDFCGEKFLYYRGNGSIASLPDERHDRLAVARILPQTKGNIFCIEECDDNNPIFDIGEPGSFDCHDILDPAAVIFNDKVFLYYSAIGAGIDSVGCAVSDDGIHFTKLGKIIIGRAPDVVVYKDEIHMIFQCLRNGAYQLFLAKSKDGIHFENVQEAPIFCPKANNWDSYSITTARLFQDGDTYYMVYGGSSYLCDEPEYFGLARSKDLADWETHPGNPIFGCGAKGTPDGGAIWFPALYETPEHFVMLYEGSYGNYSWELTSQICMSTIKKY